MSESTEGKTSEPQEGGDTDAKTFDAEYVDKLRKEAAKYRTEAKANADAAKRLAEIQESQKSAEQKSAERIAEIERELATTKHEALKRRVQAAHQIADDDADLFLTGSDIETLTAQAKRLVQRDSERKQQGNHVPTEGKNPKPAGTDDLREFTRGLFGRAVQE